MAGEQSPDGLSPESAFGLIGHEIRAEIIRVLGDARDPHRPPAVVPFAELRSRCSVDVGSSKFNYHLKQLVGSFVEPTDDGYHLSHSGTTLYRTIRARAGDDVTVGPHEAGFDCYHCETPVEATYEDGGYAVECPECEFVYDWTLVPPGATSTADEDALERLDRYVRDRRRAFVRGVCPICANGLETRLVDPDDAAYPRPDLRSVVVNRYCDHCTNLRYLTVGEVLRLRPVVADFFRDRGVDVRSAILWNLPFAVTDRSISVRSRDPWEVSFDIECNGDALAMTVDGTLEIVECTIH